MEFPVFPFPRKRGSTRSHGAAPKNSQEQMKSSVFGSAEKRVTLPRANGWDPANDGNRMGVSFGAPHNPQQQMRSSVFDVDASVSQRNIDPRTGRWLDNDPKAVQHKPNLDQAYNPKSLNEQQKQAPTPSAAASTTAAAFGWQGSAARPSSVNVPVTPSVAGTPKPPATLKREPTMAEKAPEKSEDIEPILREMREALKQRGAVGLHGLARNFRICNTDKSGKVRLALSS